MMLPIRRVFPVLLAGCVVVAGCGGKDGTGPGGGPTGVSVLTGEAQTGTVGGVLPVQVVFKAANSSGGVAGVSISVAVPAGQGGSVSPQNGTTDANGLFTVSWTLGSAPGPQTITATATGGFSATAHATANVGPPVSVVASSAAFQYVVVGHAAPILPTVVVADAFGNPLPGVAVTFETLSAGEVLTGPAQTTDASGHATVGSWTIGPDALSYQVRARIANGAVAIFEARGAPATLVSVAGNGQTGNAGTVLAIAPAVRAARDDGSPLPNVAIAFTVTAGGGQIDASSPVTGTDGIARADRWILGTTAGLNTVNALAQGAPPVTFTATGIAAIASALLASSPTTQSGFFGNYLSGTPALRVTDAGGNPVAGQAVTFAITQGGGQLTGGSTTTDFDGRASLRSWRLGNAASNIILATVGALAPLSFNATGSAPPASTFKIEVRYGAGTPTTAQKAAFDLAVARWTQLILAGAPPYLVFEDAEPCAPSIIGETVDGLVIFADLNPIDGVGGVLGRSAPCIVRDDPGYLPAEGLMEFDTSDLATLEANGQLNTVILHEMGHVLGYGTIWDFDPFPGVKPANAFLVGLGGGNPFFNGSTARAAFSGAAAPLGAVFSGLSVPVESGGGSGTAYSHWRESVLGNELMTGFLNGGSNPLSAITVDQFRDLGYVVNDAVADAYTFQAALQGAFQAPLQLVEGRVPGDIIVINRQGHAVGRIPRR
jgi:hypothetical protein